MRHEWRCGYKGGVISDALLYRWLISVTWRTQTLHYRIFFVFRICEGFHLETATPNNNGKTQELLEKLKIIHVMQAVCFD